MRLNIRLIGVLYGILVIAMIGYWLFRIALQSSGGRSSSRNKKGGPIPFILLGIKKLRSITTATIASVGILVGMWLERYLIIIPTLSLSRLAAATGKYSPSWVEISITVATFAAMAALYMIFAKLFPIVSVWEFEPHEQEEE